jgi:flagellar protein FlgJ
VSLNIDQNLQMAQMQALSAKQDASLTSAEAKIAGKTEAASREKIKKLSEEFESLFLGIVLKSMRDTVPKSTLIDGGNAEDIYRSMLDTEYAQQMASQRSTGIADNVEAFLLEGSGLKPNPDLKGMNLKTLSAAQKAAPSMALKAYEASGLRQPQKQETIGVGSSYPSALDLMRRR